MRYLHATLGLFLFLLALGFTLKNTEVVTLHYYLGLAWRTPLSLALLIAFCAGVLAAIVAGFSLLISQRRRMIGLQRELDTLQNRQE
ncbi:MAG TPA: LapA family protein [Anaerolineae bacterium]|nr:LapA family protein [Anaerolineae bacterium]